MADTVNFLQNGYSGEVLEDLLTYTVQGNDTVREGLIHIKTGIQHRYTLPAIKLGNNSGQCADPTAHSRFQRG